MTRIITALTIIVIALIGKLHAQEVTGHWTGILEVPGASLSINFHISAEENILSTTMDSPDQGAMGMPTSSTSFNENTLVIAMDEKKVNYTATLEGDVLNGTFSQGGNSIPLKMSRAAEEDTKAKRRPQDPSEPFPYHVEDVKFKNPTANNIQLAGTLTIPANASKSAAVILISGSGPQNRDEEIYNHRPFLVLADHLTRNGIAVLRYDDRGVAESEGTQKGATSADFATDVEAAVNYLRTRKEIDPKKIGLAGHSEGGFIAPMVAAKDKDIAFLVLLAGTGIDGEEILVSQTTRAQELAGAPKDALAFNEQLMRVMLGTVKKSTNHDKIEEEIINTMKSFRDNQKNLYSAAITDQLIKREASTFSDPWMVYFVKTDPATFLKQVKCPVLALNGEKDYQVISNLNLPPIETALKAAKNKDVTITELPNLNHLFQTSTKGSSEEYVKIDETFSPKALTLINNWILERTK